MRIPWCNKSLQNIRALELIWKHVLHSLFQGQILTISDKPEALVHTPTVKISAWKKAVNNILSSLQRWITPVTCKKPFNVCLAVYLHFQTDPHQLLLFIRRIQHYFAVKLPKSCVEEETFPFVLSAWGWVEFSICLT